MARDKYGVEHDPDCYPGTSVLINHLNLRDDAALSEAEIVLTLAASETLEFQLPPYDFTYLKRLHHHLFKAIYPWAGKVRSTDISKGNTRFCTASRIEPEGERLFRQLAKQQWFANASRSQLISDVAEYFGELNMLHPFREGNGRTLRLLFEHLIINVGFEVDWTPIHQEEWIEANIAAVDCDYTKMAMIFDRCIGE
ncbi:Fic family protein [Spongiibacter sp. KMU-158]|uniref:protein adenylyltransferase n=1 Tax=Spongiibacter pelagi TaxID=2760804 RepID=A0A927C4S4_9GAMM|nr:Fic family protein [Spongiibacter pelagi]MBD2860153.1 Fic family protein [Spongiibacter pelagi]